MMIGQSALSGLTMRRAVVYRKKVYTYGIGHQLQEINKFLCGHCQFISSIDGDLRFTTDGILKSLSYNYKEEKIKI